MSKYVGAVAAIREAAGKTFALIVHHSGKDSAKGMRGHSSLRAAVDVELECTMGENGGTIREAKERDERGRRSFGFRLQQVELGENSKGRMITTCVAVAAETPKKESVITMTARQKLVLDCLHTAIVDHGEKPPPAFDIPPHVRVVDYERWRDVALHHIADMKDASGRRQREAFGRVAEALQAKGLIRQVDAWC